MQDTQHQCFVWAAEYVAQHEHEKGNESSCKGDYPQSHTHTHQLFISIFRCFRSVGYYFGYLSPEKNFRFRLYAKHNFSKILSKLFLNPSPAKHVTKHPEYFFM
jgi:hypothetical protein